VTRTPSAGNERISEEEFHRFVGFGLDLFRRLDDEGTRALRVAREWEGHAIAAHWDTAPTPPDPDAPLEPVRTTRIHQTSDGDPDVPPDHSDRTGEAAMRPDWTAGVYAVMVDQIRNIARYMPLLEGVMDRVKASELDADTLHTLKRINATAGQCDACGRHHSGQRKPHDDRLKVAPQTDPPRLYGPDCYSAWVRNLAAAQPATVRVFERMRATRQERDGAA
jgi:hypothetical protein